MVLGICQKSQMNLLLLCVSRVYCALKMGRIKKQMEREKKGDQIYQH